MKRRLLTLSVLVILASSLLFGGGTYALLKATEANGQNDFGDYQAQKLTIKTFATTNTTDITLPMFYDQRSFPNGPNPYDVKTNFIPSGELPGEWSPGDTVRRTWDVKNEDAASKISEIYSPPVKFFLEDANGNLISSGTQIYQDFLNHMKLDVYYPVDSMTPVYTGTFQQLLQAPQPMSIIIALSKGATEKVAFVASMDRNAGNELQGVKGVLDFQLGAEQVANNCFDPPFSHDGYSMQLGSTTPIKFECYDSYGNLIKSNQDVKLVISGGNLGQGLIYTLGNGLSFNGGHYQTNITNDGSFVDGVTYTATIYNGSEICGQKTFTTQPGSRPQNPK